MHERNTGDPTIDKLIESAGSGNSSAAATVALVFMVEKLVEQQKRTADQLEASNLIAYAAAGGARAESVHDRVLDLLGLS